MLRFLNFPMILLLWAAYLTCYPTWVGHLYHADVMDPASQLQSGTFGLKEETESNPFWHPPVAYSDEMGATLRLPWQPVTRSAHIEIDTNQWWLHFTLGTMSLGLFIGTWALINRKVAGDTVSITLSTLPRFVVMMLAGVGIVLLLGQLTPMGYTFMMVHRTSAFLIVCLFILSLLVGIPKATASIATWMGLALAAGWLVLLLLAMASSGYIFAAETMVNFILLATMLAGGVLGFVLHQRQRV